WVGLRGEMTIAGLAQVALAAAVILASFDHRFAYVSLDTSCIQFYLLPGDIGDDGLSATAFQYCTDGFSEYAALNYLGGCLWLCRASSRPIRLKQDLPKCGGSCSARSTDAALFTMCGG
ncbi:MAG: hypothetical protein NZM04_00405, partial [Methylacidiphilales bacterium]|nr:hypothetical protein [Candidatus Methylacidiphilales bacterium]